MLDDDKPDYFLSGNSTESSGDTQQPDDGRIIDFGTATGEGSPTTTATPAGRRHSKMRRVIAATAIVGVLVLAVAFYLRYCSPYAVDAATTVYVVNVEKRGIIFKTYEAQVVAADAIADTSQVYSHPEQFTVESEQLAHELQLYQGRRQAVTLRYEKYYATLPWRGSSKRVVTSIETKR